MIKDAVSQSPLRKTLQSAKRMMTMDQTKPHQAANGTSLLCHGRFSGLMPCAFKPRRKRMLVIQIPNQLNIPVTALMLANQPKTVFEELETAIYDKAARAEQRANE